MKNSLFEIVFKIKFKLSRFSLIFHRPYDLGDNEDTPSAKF